MAEELTIGFVGNPNCGKTTLFNAYTGANLKVANWPGVTVEKKEGRFQYHDREYKLVDLPGTYSLTSYTMEEQVTRQYILSDDVDVIIDVADASSLGRNLYLTLQLIELGKPVILALNMMDIVEKRGMEIDTHRLPEMLGIPVIPVSARRKTGLDILMHAAAHHKDHKHDIPLIHHHGEDEPQTLQTKHRHHHHSEYAMVYSDELEDKIDLVMDALRAKYPDLRNYRWHALKLLERDKEITAQYPVDLPDVLDRSYEKDIINQKYDFIDEVIQEVLVNKDRKAAVTDKADKFLVNRWLGLPIFLVIMALVFFLTFTIGDWLKGYFETGLELFSGGVRGGLESLHVPAAVISLLVDGIISGVGGILTFLPTVERCVLFGGQRLHGPGGLRHGRHYGQAGPVGPVLHPHGAGLWLHGAGHHGLPRPGEQAGPVQDHAHHPLYVLQRAAAHLRALLPDVLPGERHGGGLLPVRAGAGGGGAHRLPHPPHRQEARPGGHPAHRAAGV